VGKFGVRTASQVEGIEAASVGNESHQSGAVLNDVSAVDCQTATLPGSRNTHAVSKQFANRRTTLPFLTK